MPPHMGLASMDVAGLYRSDGTQRHQQESSVCECFAEFHVDSSGSYEPVRAVRKARWATDSSSVECCAQGQKSWEAEVAVLVGRVDFMRSCILGQHKHSGMAGFTESRPVLMHHDYCQSWSDEAWCSRRFTSKLCVVRCDCKTFESTV